MNKARAFQMKQGSLPGPLQVPQASFSFATVISLSQSADVLFLVSFSSYHAVDAELALSACLSDERNQALGVKGYSLKKIKWERF